VVDPAELAKFVLSSFGVKTPEKFIMQQPPMMPGPPGMPPGMPPMGPEGAPPPEDEMPEDTEPGGGQIPPELAAQLQGQVGLDLNTMGAGA
jgi:hypothetical protein